MEVRLREDHLLSLVDKSDKIPFAFLLYACEYFHEYAGEEGKVGVYLFLPGTTRYHWYSFDV